MGFERECYELRDLELELEREHRFQLVSFTAVRALAHHEVLEHS